MIRPDRGWGPHVSRVRNYVTLRLPSDGRPPVNACIILVTRGHILSRDKDGGVQHSTTVSENPTLHANFMANRSYGSFTFRE